MKQFLEYFHQSITIKSYFNQHLVMQQADKKLNIVHTRFGIASGCKLFTAVSICQLVEKGLLSFETRLENCLNIKFPHFNKP